MSEASPGELRRQLRTGHAGRRELPRTVALVGHAANLASHELAQVAVQVQHQVAGRVGHPGHDRPQLTVVEGLELVGEAGQVAAELGGELDAERHAAIMPQPPPDY